MAIPNDVVIYKVLAEHLEYTCRSAARKKLPPPQKLKELKANVDQAFINAAKAARTDYDRMIVIDTQAKLQNFRHVGPATSPIGNPTHFLEAAVLENDPDGALEYFNALNNKTQEYAYGYLCKQFGSTSKNVIQEGRAHLLKDPHSALLLADENSTPLYMHLKELEERFHQSYLATTKDQAGFNYRTAIMQETLDAINQGYNLPDKTAKIFMRFPLALLKLSADKVEVFKSGGQSGQRPGNLHTNIVVVNKDCLYVAMELQAQGLNPLVLNMANAQNPGGGYRKGARAQEEDIFRRTTASVVLDSTWGVQEKNFYPLTQFSESAGLHSPEIQILRYGKDRGYAFLPKPVEVALATIAAIYNPTLKTVKDKSRLYDKDAEITRERVCTIHEMGYQKKHRALVLGALGCGAFNNPPSHMAEIILDVIKTRYAHCFEVIVIAIVEDQNSVMNAEGGNFLPFAKQVVAAGGKAYDQNNKELTFQE